MITQYMILMTKLEQGGWLAQLCHEKRILAEVTRSTQLNALTDVRRQADPEFARLERTT